MLEFRPQQVLADALALLAQVAAKQIYEAQDLPQGRPQVVRHRIAERFELAIGGLELRRALDHAPLELGVEPADLGLGRRLGGVLGHRGELARRGALAAARRYELDDVVDRDT